MPRAALWIRRHRAGITAVSVQGLVQGQRSLGHTFIFPVHPISLLKWLLPEFCPNSCALGRVGGCKGAALPLYSQKSSLGFCTGVSFPEHSSMLLLWVRKCTTKPPS